jgi:putative phosphoribosyl transferase
VEAGKVCLDGCLTVPRNASGIVLFAHEGGSGRKSPRNQFTARELNNAGLATLLFDLLTPREDLKDRISGEFRLNVPLLVHRLIGATDWIKQHPDTKNLNLGYFGASTGSAVALISAAVKPEKVKAVVSRGGRPDLAMKALPSVKAPTLLIAGGKDHAILDLNKRALAELKTQKDLIVISGATQLFEEPGSLRKVAHLAANWFQKHLS